MIALNTCVDMPITNIEREIDMAISVGSMANYTYSMYELQNSDTYSKYAVDQNDVSEEFYNVSDVSTLLETLGNTDSADFSSLTNANSYAKSQLTLSQLSCYDTLNTVLSDTGMNNVLSNHTDLNGLYRHLGTSGITKAAISSLLDAYASAAKDSYKSYADSNSSASSLLDTKA